MYIVLLSDPSRYFFEEASAKLQRSLDRCFEQLKNSPKYHPNIKPLKGNLSGYYRYRVGDYRVLYTIDEQENLVFVNAIAHRSQIYE